MKSHFSTHWKIFILLFYLLTYFIGFNIPKKIKNYHFDISWTFVFYPTVHSSSRVLHSVQCENLQLNCMVYFESALSSHLLAFLWFYFIGCFLFLCATTNNIDNIDNVLHPHWCYPSRVFSNNSTSYAGVRMRTSFLLICIQLQKQRFHCHQVFHWIFIQLWYSQVFLFIVLFLQLLCSATNALFDFVAFAKNLFFCRCVCNLIELIRLLLMLPTFN